MDPSIAPSYISYSRLDSAILVLIYCLLIPSLLWVRMFLTMIYLVFDFGL
jgi:hypothetical protein